MPKKARSRLASSRAGYHGQGAAEPAPASDNPVAAARTAPQLARPPPLSEGLLNKAEVCALVGKSYQCLWLWMRVNRFPRSRLVGSRPAWIKSEVLAWIEALPLVRLKGDE
jgi:predicted DNA-binding transcriptional regulator AlpA